MVIGRHRATRITVDLGAIRENIKNEKKRLVGKEMFAVVKADAYGHGAVPVAKACEEAGVDGFCVAVMDEGIQLREAGFTEPILILSMIDPQYLSFLMQYDLAVTAGSLEWLEACCRVWKTLPNRQPLKIHLKVDSGMGRIGFRTPEEVHEAARFLLDEAAFDFEGIFTHFATADEADEKYYQKQAKRFSQAVAALPARPPYIHVSNSATALWHDAGEIGNMVRYGVALYGLNPSGAALALPYPLKPALSMTSELTQVKEVAAGEGISYGKTYVTETAEWIGTIPIGYADGWLRRMQGFKLLVEGVRCEIIGRICMDQLMIRLPKRFPEGTTVTLVGASGNDAITLEEIAEYADTIHYEVACCFSPRIPRVYRDSAD